MCGIAGYKINKRTDEGIIKRMVAQLYHRGPDAEGYYHSGPYHGGMRRLTINDLHTGNQPLYNESKDVVLFYNGEIYNSPALREKLSHKGYSFKTTCDGEVICHLYDEYGEELFELLDGMFAVALWDEKKNKLILARDIPGEKPLYYSKLSSSELVFSSEIKSLRCFPELDTRLNYQAIWDLPTFLWVPEPNTIYQSVQALMPGHMLILDDEGICIKKYKNKFNTDSIDSSDESMVTETRRIVEQAIKSRLLSDVPVGCFLSGGLDSSIVTTIAAQHRDDLSTFTVGFEDVADPYHGHADESLAAEAYAKKLNTKHHTIRVVGQTFKDALDDFCRYSDQPFGVSSGLGLLSIAKAARESGIKVLLSGDGADELFGGYSWYFHLPLKAVATVGAAVGVEDVSAQNYGMDMNERLEHLSQYPAHKRAWAWHYYASEFEKKKLFAEDFCAVQSSLRHFENYNPAAEWNEVDYIKQDRQFYLPNEMLRKVDRMTMAYSVEGRAPFVAPGVLSHVEKLTYNQMVRGQDLKWVLRQAFNDVLPSEIINRPKHGFNVPVDHWLKNDWANLVDETFSVSSALYRHGITHKESLQRAKEMVADENRLNGHSILTFIMLNRWLERSI